MVVGFCPYMRSARDFTKDMRARMEQGIFEKRKEEGRLATKGEGDHVSADNKEQTADLHHCTSAVRNRTSIP